MIDNRNYEKAYGLWQSQQRQGEETPPPVFIVVCNNTNVSKLVYDWASGWEKKLDSNTAVWVPGKLEIFSNVKNGKPVLRRNTILVDSEQIESGEAMSPEFKKIAAAEIDEFKNEYRARFPGRDADSLTDEDLLREVLNTVGKLGKLGENVKCVVSVSMLTEGWDANTVTHILGVRAFGTQLLCEQVVGRGLRRMSYQPNEDGKFEAEYAEVYGVPFSFIPCSGSTPDSKPPKKVVRVRALEERSAWEIQFPRIVGYRYDFPAERLTPKFTRQSRHILSTRDIATQTEVRTIIGQAEVHTLEGLRNRRLQEVVFLLAKLTLELHLKDEEGCLRPWLFPSLLRITRDWMDNYLQCQDNIFPQLLLVEGKAREVAEKIARAVVAGADGEKVLKPVLRPYDPVGSTKSVDFNTSRATYQTRPDKCHISHVVADTQSWEQKMAANLEEMDEVIAYVKNQNLGFSIPYVFEGKERHYYPDFIARVTYGEQELNLIVEVSGQPGEAKTAKAFTAQNLWVPAVNNHGGFGRWDYVECTDPWDGKTLIRRHLKQGSEQRSHG